MAAPASGYDGTFRNLLAADTTGTASVMFDMHRQQDITPSSARRSDGDARFQLIPSESFWSQNDWSAGYGRIYPADPAAFWRGPADTVSGRVVRQALVATSVWNSGTWGANPAVNAICGDPATGVVYFAIENAGVGYVGSYNPSTNAWTTIATLGSPTVTSMVLFRGSLWMAYGSGVYNIQRYKFYAGTFTTLGVSGELLCGYSSMLFFTRYDAATFSWRLNRYDPDNAAAVPDLAALDGTISTSFVRSLVALGADLYLVTATAVWKFTSQNGNSGILVGPVDTFIAVGEGGQNTAGYGAVAYQGTLVFPVGAALRRYQPGGGGKQIWPIPPSVNYPDSDLELAGRGRQITQLVAVADRLYGAASLAPVGGAYTTNTQEISIFCWTGTGMHWLAQQAITYTGTPTLGRALLASDGRGYLVGLTTAKPFSGATTGHSLYYWGVAFQASQVRATSTTLRTSILDFGLADIEKIVSQVRVRYRVPSTSTHAVAATLYWLDESLATPAWTAVTLTRSGNLSTTVDAATFQTFTAAAPVAAKRFYIELTLTGSASTSTVEVEAITCIPNPIYPLRYGFRVQIPIGTQVRNHNGDLAYASQAAVDTAVAYWRSRRSLGYPVYLDYLDGTTYQVRLNTISIVRDALRPTESGWTVTLDLQQLTG